MLRVVIFLVLLQVCGFLAAQEQADSAPAVDAEPDKTAVQAEKTPPEEADRPVVTPETFQPSEEISEDLSVSFPVDI